MTIIIKSTPIREAQPDFFIEYSKNSPESFRQRMERWIKRNLGIVE